MKPANINQVEGLIYKIKSLEELLEDIQDHKCLATKFYLSMYNQGRESISLSGLTPRESNQIYHLMIKILRDHIKAAEQELKSL